MSNTTFGLAIDLGTTNVCMGLCDMSSGKVVKTVTCRNRQSMVSSEVITRLTVALESSEQARRMQAYALDTISEALDSLSEDGYSKQDIGYIVIVANTAMLVLLTAHDASKLLDPQNWAAVVDCTPSDNASLIRMLGVNENSQLSIVQPLGGFVGSDLLAGLIKTKIYAKGQKSLFVDIGTNSEVVFFDGQTVWATSTAGGPAFEGCGISCGMGAADGAVYKISDEWEYDTLGHGVATGLCGSGLIDALAIFLREGRLDCKGKIAGQTSKLNLPNTHFHLESRDIDTLQRAKAAVRAGIDALLGSSGIKAEELDKVYVSGAFGEYLNCVNAIGIGLFPPISLDKFVICGNTALEGCEELLVSSVASDELDEIRKHSRVVNLASMEIFEELFFKYLYFPKK